MTAICLTRSAGLGLALAGAVACGNPGTPVQCFCTEEFRIFTLTVIDNAGDPVSDVVLTRTLVRTGELQEPGWLGLLVPGTYLVADDGMLDVFSSDDDTLRVAGEKDGSTFSVDLVFGVPEPCRCHVEHLAGPDTVILGN